MKLKNEKGVTLVILSVTIIILLIVTGITITSSRGQLAVKKLNYLYSDIDSISTKTSDYYLKNNSLPIYGENAYFNSKDEFVDFVSSKKEDTDFINENDDGAYYVLNLNKLDNLTLNYGKDYSSWSSTGSSSTLQDLYIINVVSHQIYYPQGIKFNNKLYFTYNVSSKAIEPIKLEAVADAFEIASIGATKILIADSDNKVVMNADVTLNIGENYNLDTLQYAWTVEGDTSTTIEYTPVDIKTASTVTVMSRELENSEKYMLYFKILDTNGKEHLLSREITTTT